MNVRSPDQMPPQSAFAGLLGIQIVTVTAAEVVCRMEVTPQMANRNGVLHGGALMTLADNAAGSAAFAGSPAGMTNTTIEAKTNFIRAVRLGDVVTARCVPLHVGGRTMVLQTTLTRGDGKTVGVTTQTHLLMRWTEPQETTP